MSQELKIWAQAPPVLATLVPTPSVAHVIEVVDGVPVGWTLGQNSWPAHRMFYKEVGRVMAFGEYSRLLRDRGAGAECLSKSLNVWRVLGDQAECIVVQRSGDRVRQILPADWAVSVPPARATTSTDETAGHTGPGASIKSHVP
jgi:hypothetical protein